MSVDRPEGSAAPAGLREPAFGADGAGAERLVASLIALSPYRRALAPLLRDVTRVALMNRQVATALAAAEQRADFGRTGRLGRADLGADRAALLQFLEYVRFASPDFLGSVGEWPLGEIRG